MSYSPAYFGGAANSQPPSQYGPDYAQGPYSGQYSTSPHSGSYGAQYPPAPLSQSSAWHQQGYYQAGSYLAPGPVHGGRASFDSASTTMYSPSAQSGGNSFVQPRGQGNKSSATSVGTHGSGCSCTIM